MALQIGFNVIAFLIICVDSTTSSMSTRIKHFIPDNLWIRYSCFFWARFPFNRETTSKSLHCLNCASINSNTSFGFFCKLSKRYGFYWLNIQNSQIILLPIGCKTLKFVSLPPKYQCEEPNGMILYSESIHFFMDEMIWSSRKSLSKLRSIDFISSKHPLMISFGSKEIFGLDIGL